MKHFNLKYELLSIHSVIMGFVKKKDYKKPTNRLN